MLDGQISHIIGLSLMCCGQKLITKTRKGSKCLCIIVQLQLKLDILFYVVQSCIGKGRDSKTSVRTDCPYAFLHSDQEQNSV